MSVPSIISMPKNNLINLGLNFSNDIHYQLSPEQLTQQAVDRGEGVLCDTGALVINTGKFTGRSPKDKFTVKDAITENTVHWNDFNIPIEEKYFFQLKEKMLAYLAGKEIWVRDCYACADENFKLRLRVINENPWSNLFAYNMFIRPEEKDLETMAFGEKSQQKGIKMGDYDKKMKAPKASPTELYIESKKKITKKR